MSIFKGADILLPENADYTKWSVVACDQYSSEPSYWKTAEEIVGDSPSTLKIIYPEAYLNEPDGDGRIKRINATMQEYIDGGVFREYPDSLIYVERTQGNGKIRRGIVGCIDLEAYDYSVGSVSPVRATEGTIISRIPPRVRIRQNAPLELPHIIMLADDRKREIIEYASEKSAGFEVVYDFELMQGGGHIKGMAIDAETKAEILARIEKLEDRAEFEDKYGVKGESVLAIAVGDGNHSLATAKSCWEEIKKGLTAEERENHPSRFALAELENLHDDALEFEPIHRVVFGVDPTHVMEELYKFYPETSESDNGGHKICVVYGGHKKTVYVKNSPCNLPVGTFQKFMDEYLKNNGGEIDYIHGADVVDTLTAAENSIGFVFDAMEKNDLFTTVIKDGALPRKTFSMGEAQDKRFYLEAKRIK